MKKNLRTIVLGIIHFSIFTRCYAEMTLPPETMAEGIDAGLVLYYPFSANAGTTATDASGNGHHGTVVNAKWRDAGPQGGYLYFDGNGDYVDVGTSVNFPAWEKYSISLWFLNDGGGDNSGYGQKLLDKTSWYHDAHIRMTPTSPGNTGYVSYNLYEGGAGAGVGAFPSNQVRGDNLWHHIVIVRDGTNAFCWYDGVQGGVINNALSVYSPSPLYIGYSAASSSDQKHYWSGFIDEVRIYDRAISTNEASQLYQLVC